MNAILTDETILVTGGSGFIGSNYILRRLSSGCGRVINLDKLTYAGNPNNLATIERDERYIFVRGDIGDREMVRRLLAEHTPAAVVNFAAESHVDRSILGPEAFVETNVQGTFGLLEGTLGYWRGLSERERSLFRFLHISTDEVYGSLRTQDHPFTEDSPYAPNSPYAATKAASDHLVRAYGETYGLPVIITNCSNNYGPRQFPEKLIPLMILSAIEGKTMPVYGDGLNIRDWLYVADHCEALDLVLSEGQPGQTYNIGGCCERSNIETVQEICKVLDELCPESPVRPHRRLISFVKDRPGHDRRYAIDCSKIGRELGWRPRHPFSMGIRMTVEWYLGNRGWIDSIHTGGYRDWMKINYDDRRGDIETAC